MVFLIRMFPCYCCFAYHVVVRNCSLYAPHTQIKCYFPPGTGYYSLRIDIAGQTVTSIQEYASMLISVYVFVYVYIAHKLNRL